MNPGGQTTHWTRCPYDHHQEWNGHGWDSCKTCKKGHSDPLATEFNMGAACAFGFMGIGEGIAKRNKSVIKLIEIANAAIELARSGYDGPFMGKEVEPLFRAIRELDKISK